MVLIQSSTCLRLLFIGLSIIWSVSCSPSRLTRRLQEITPPAGAIVVRQSGTGAYEFQTISAAVASLTSGTDALKTIFIYPGIYREQVTITYPGPLKIQGYTTDAHSFHSNQVTITNSMTAAIAGTNDQSATVRAHKSMLSVYNINIENTSGNYAYHSQAVALSATGYQQGYYGCKISGYQDTLLARNGTQVFAGSLIAGAVDFIFGRALAWFDNSIIDVVGPGTITASGRDSDSDPSWFIFNRCSIKGKNQAAGSTYLGRPWRNFARVMFQICQLDAVVNAAGWSVWQPTDWRTDHVNFAEYNNFGAGAVKSRQFGYQGPSPLSLSGMFGDTSWIDQVYLSRG